LPISLKTKFLTRHIQKQRHETWQRLYCLSVFWTKKAESKWAIRNKQKQNQSVYCFTNTRSWAFFRNGSGYFSGTSRRL